MHRIKLILVAIFLLCAPSYLLADSKALSYQDCILEIVREGAIASQRDIGRVKQLCEERFPDTVSNIIGEKLADSVMEEIEIYTNRGSDGVINGSVYNGNGHIVLTRLELLLTPRTKKGSVLDFFDSEEYRINLIIKPYSTEHFSIKSEKTEIKGPFSWKLIRAWGR